MSEGWCPLLRGEDVRRATDAIDGITADLLRCVSNGSGPGGQTFADGLGSGRVGMALFLGWSASVDNSLVNVVEPVAESYGVAVPSGSAGLSDARSERVSAAAFDLLAASIAGQTRSPSGLSLCDGLAGIGWAVAHLAGRLVPPSCGDPMAAIDSAMAEVLGDPAAVFAAELLYGLAGYGLCALERRPAPGAGVNLTQIAELLVRAAIPIPGGLAWRTPAASLPGGSQTADPLGRVDLGLAHGATGTVVVLARISAMLAAAGIPDARLDQVVAGAVSGILHQRTDGQGGTTVPPFVGHALAGTARTGWCYGDLGVAVALLAAARQVGRTDWEAAALDLARIAASRPDVRFNVLGTGLCHGAAGVAHLFNRVFQASGEPLFRNAAARWFRRVLEQRRPGEGIGGYGAWRGSPARWWADPGLLDGAAGVGLVLLAAISPVEPEWDRCLALSAPAPVHGEWRR